MKNKGFSGMFGPRIFFRGLFFCVTEQKYIRNVWAKNCFFKVAVNWFSSLFFGFGLRRLLSATETTKNQKTSNKNQKKQKKQRILRNVFVQRHWFFCFFGFPRVFLVLGSGGFYRLLRLPKTKKPRTKTKKNKKNKGF